MATLRETFQKLPPAIKDWLVSDRATNTVIELNKRLKLDGELLRILPTLILRFVVKDIRPENFIPELMAEFDLNFNDAIGFAREIHEKILKPIEALLASQLGVDVKLIYRAQPPAEKPAAVAPQSMPQSPPTPVATRVVPPVINRVEPPVLKASNVEPPFIIYRENPIFSETPKPPPQSTTQVKPEIKIPVKIQSQSAIPIKPEAPKATLLTEVVSTPQEQRVVHYNNLTTPLQK